MEDENNGFGLLGQYGVVIVPPSSPEGQWFVTLASWDAEAEEYVAGSDGPIFEAREDAMVEANKVLDWLKSVSHDDDLARVWQAMQARLSADDVGEAYPLLRWPWSL